MVNFIFGLLFAGLFGAIIYLYLRERSKAIEESIRVNLNELKKQIDETSPQYRKQVDDYNDFVQLNASILRKYGIDPATVIRKQYIADVRSGHFIETTTGHVVTAAGERLATRTD